MRRNTTVIIGAGHAGLAMSRCLAERGVDHVVLERGEVANSWRTERWDSLRLLTPNWQRRLPGFGYEGDDPDGFGTMPEVGGARRRRRARRRGGRGSWRSPPRCRSSSSAARSSIAASSTAPSSPTTTSSPSRRRRRRWSRPTWCRPSIAAWRRRRETGR